MTKLINKNVLITGASSGIGKATALAYAAKGANIVLTYNSHEEEANTIVKEIEAKGRKAKAIKIDFSTSNSKALELLLKEAIEYLGAINVLVNNAGILIVKDYEKTDEDELDKILQVNVKTPYFLTQHFVKYSMEQIKKIDNYGRPKVIVVSSISDKVHVPDLETYDLTKGALTSWAEAIALKYAKNININIVAPGLIKTGLNESLHTPTGSKEEKITKEAQWTDIVKKIPSQEVYSTEDIVDIMILLASDKSRGVIGSRIVWPDGGRSLGPI
ncbi:MAG: SDR family NAD(P)-dependent oxidoreductase [Alphaproteobacteria bacterium]